MPERAGGLQERFRRWLRDRHQPITSQRDLVAAVVFEADRHLSVDDVAAELRRRGEHVGTATIYRTLDTLVDAGLARAHDFGEGFRRYEAHDSRGAHGHLVCRRCGVVTEFELEQLERALPLLADAHGFLAESHRVELHGLCQPCRRREVGATALPALVGRQR